MPCSFKFLQVALMFCCLNASVPSRYGKLFSAHMHNWSDLNFLKGAAISYTQAGEDGGCKRVVKPVRCGQQIVQLFEDLIERKLKVKRGIMIKGHMFPNRIHYLYLHNDSVCVSLVKPSGGWIKGEGRPPSVDLEAFRIDN